MPHHVSRRDFLNGFQLLVAAGLAPLDQALAATSNPPTDYPPAWTGLRGSTDASFQVMHAVAREKKTYAFEHVNATETYDLVVIGAGLAGLTAAWLYAKRSPKARILILDNHDDFGGHARRCEFNVDGRMLLGYGGSETMVAPRTKFSGQLKKILNSLKIDPERFYDEKVFHRRLYPRLGLSRGMFFDAETFGEDRLVSGDPLLLGFDEFAPNNPNARSIRAFLKDCPLPPAVQTGLQNLFEGRTDPMKGHSPSTKLDRLSKISYRAFLSQTCALPPLACDFFQGRSHDNFGLGIDAISAKDAMSGGFPGASGLKIADALADDDHGGDEPYIHHFPDGNASIARALVRSMIPSAAPGATMSDLITARFDYAVLDSPTNRVRIRLNSTAVLVRNDEGSVTVGYIKDGVPHKLTTRKAVVATFSSVAAHLCPELADDTRNLMASNVRAPLLYIKVAIRNWESFVRLGVHKIAAPMAFLSTVKLDYPVSLGAYRFPKRPSQPMGLQLVHVPVAQNQGHDARTQARLGRQWLLETPFEKMENLVRSDLSRMLGKGGFDANRDIAAITVNRWSHGYSYAPSTLYDDPKDREQMQPSQRTKIGNIAFANSDTAWDAYAHSAMSEAVRAVTEIA